MLEQFSKAHLFENTYNFVCENRAIKRKNILALPGSKYVYILKSLYFRIPSTATIDQDAVQQTNNRLAPDTSSKLQPDASSRLQPPDTSSSPESTTTPSPMKQKVLAPWRQPGRETPKAQNVSKDNVYDFDGKILLSIRSTSTFFLTSF